MLAAPIGCVDAKPGDTIVDLGCGLGYFPRKLSSPVGSRGHVMVEDIRWLSLAFLWVRTVLRNEHNVTIIHDRQTDPHLPPN